MTDFVPPEGSPGALACEYLVSKPRGTMVTTRDLAAVVNVPTTALQGRLYGVVNHGLIRQKRLSPRKTLWYYVPPNDPTFDPSPHIATVLTMPNGSLCLWAKAQGFSLSPDPESKAKDPGPLGVAERAVAANDSPWKLVLDFCGPEPEEVVSNASEAVEETEAEHETEEPALVSDEEDAADIPGRSMSDSHYGRLLQPVNLVTTGRRLEDVLADESVPSWRKNQLTMTSKERQSQLVARFRDLLGSSDKLKTVDPHRAVARLLDVARAVREAAPESRFKSVEVDLVINREINEIGEVIERSIANLQMALDTMQRVQDPFPPRMAKL